MKVLSLFDGIACGKVALDRANIPCERYVAYEIDSPAVSIALKNHPTIEEKGDVFEGDFTQYQGFDLLIGGSPCFTKGHFVLTSKGYKDVSEVCVGDLVYTHKHRFRPVIRINKREAETYKVSTFNYGEMITTSNHPFLACKKIRDSKPYLSPEDWIPVINLESTDYIAQDIYKSESEEDSLDESSAFELGKCITVNLINSEKIESFVGDTYLKYKEYLNISETYGGIPEVVFSMRENIRESFLRGVFFACGSHDSETGIYSIRANDFKFALGLQRLIISCYVTAVRITFKENLYFVEYNLEDTGIRQNDRLWTRIHSVSPTMNRDTVYNIEVEEDHSYTVNNVIVHNCTYWSIAREKNKRELTPDGIGGRLFMEYVRALKEAQPRYFLYENNYTIPKGIKDFISRQLGVQPIIIDSALVSSQSRLRCYWTNIPNISQPQDKGIMFKDILLDEGIPIRTVKGKCNTFVASYYKVGEIPFSSYGSECARPRIALRVSSTDPRRESNRVYVVKDGQCIKIIAKDADTKKLGPLNLPDGEYIIRKVYPIEAERLQTLPDDYTKVDGISNTNRYKGVGNGWTCDVIAHIFSHIPKQENKNND